MDDRSITSSTVVDTAIIPCGGRGTRLHPITHWIPKELLPVSLRPLLYWTLDEAVQAGLRRVIVVTNPEKPVLEAAARDYDRSGVTLAFVPQDRPAGLGDALLRTRELLHGSPFAVLLPDNLFRGPNQTAAVLEAWRFAGLATVLITLISSADSKSKGATGKARVKQLADGTLRVTEVASKGTGRFDTSGDAVAATPIGRFVLPGDIFSEFEVVARGLPAGAELDDVPVLQRLATRGALRGVASTARFYDVGVPEGYRDAVCEFAPTG